MSRDEKKTPSEKLMEVLVGAIKLQNKDIIREVLRQIKSDSEIQEGICVLAMTAAVIWPVFLEEFHKAKEEIAEATKPDDSE